MRRLLLLGLARAGKSSIQQILTNKVAPNETLFLDQTHETFEDRIGHPSYAQFALCDTPGHLLDALLFDSSAAFDRLVDGAVSLIFVIDAQDDYIESLSKLFVAATRASKANPAMSLEVLIHKVDGLSDEHKIETQRDIQQRILDELADTGLDDIQLNFHLTSIYDCSIFESFSKILQNSIPQLPALENLLNVLCSSAGIEKAFLFDVVSKVYIATDSSPVDMQSYELCSDMIDVIVDMSLIYGTSGHSVLYDSSAKSCIQLSNGLMLYMREILPSLALICLYRGDPPVGGSHDLNSDHYKIGLMEYNIIAFRKAVNGIFEVYK